MRRWWVFWPLYAGLIGFMLGASFFFGLYGRNVTESEITAQHGHRPAKETPKKEEADEALAFYTLLLMIFTGVLAIATIGLGGATVLLYATGEKQFKFAMRSAVRQSRDMKASIAAANRSAAVAERALTDLEAPFVEVKIRDVGLTHNVESGRLSFSFINYGRTPARILEFDDILESVIIGETPTPPGPESRRGRAMPYGVFSPPNGGECEEFGKVVLRSELSGEPAGPHNLEDRALYFIGYVTYCDIFENVFTVGFCLLYDPMRARWSFRGDEKYNYHRKENGPYVPPQIGPTISGSR
jgi:hypothetical protein